MTDALFALLTIFLKCSVVTPMQSPDEQETRSQDVCTRGRTL